MMAHAKDLNCDCIVFDNELLPLQQRAWEEETGILVIDRQEVILDIFNMRAQTKEAAASGSARSDGIFSSQDSPSMWGAPRPARAEVGGGRTGGGGGSDPGTRGDKTD